ncbi:MAG: hypothetical protein AB8B53_05165 [Flavobacteriales bacterium]
MDKLGFEEVRNLTKLILHWQKHIIKYPEPFNEDFQKDRFILIEPDQEMFPKLYKNCLELEQVFKLNGTEIVFNQDLSEEEIKEIQEYINEHHKITARWKSRRKRTK